MLGREDERPLERGWGVKWKKIKLQTILRNLLDKLRKLHMHGTVMHLEMFSLPQPIENSDLVYSG